MTNLHYVEVMSRCEGLMQRLKQQQDNLWTCSLSRKKFEGDCQIIERWCKETVMACERPMLLDREAIEEHYKFYKVSLAYLCRLFYILKELILSGKKNECKCVKRG